MEKHKEKIRKFSEVIHILLQIAFIALIIAGAMEAFAWIWSLLQLNTEVISIAGVEKEVPLLFKIGNFRVLLPVMWDLDYSLLSNRYSSAVTFSNVALTVVSIVVVGFAKEVFKLLRENGSPFRDDVVASLKKLAIALLVVGVASGVIPFLAAGVVWVFCLIFDYGRALQYESDTTL